MLWAEVRWGWDHLEVLGDLSAGKVLVGRSRALMMKNTNGCEAGRRDGERCV